MRPEGEGASPDVLRNWNKSEQMDACLDACAGHAQSWLHGILVLVEAGLKPASTAALS